MRTQTFNPYPEIGTQLSSGLDAISKSMKPTSTVNDLADAIYKYIQPIYYPKPVSDQVQIEIRSVVYNIINAYNNKALGNIITYSEEQMKFAYLMLGLNTTNNVPVNGLDMWLSDIEDTISEAGLSLADQTPLLLSAVNGRAVYAYWIAKAATPGSWAPFFQKPEAINYANIPAWTAACMAGSLIGANTSEKGLIAPTTDITSVNIISALIGALAIGAGKVIFKWVPQIQPRDLTSDIDGLLLGGFSDAIDMGSGMTQRRKKNEGCASNGHCNNVDCTNTCTNTATCNGSTK